MLKKILMLPLILLGVVLGLIVLVVASCFLIEAFKVLPEYLQILLTMLNIAFSICMLIYVAYTYNK